MLLLSPTKLLVVLVIALIVLGPDKLPDLAHRLGAMWGDLRRWRTRLESEVRGTFPDLPPTHEVVRAVRSPLAFLDRLADEHEGTAASGAEQSAGDRAELPATSSGAGQVGAPGGPSPNGSGGEPIVVPDDPSMN